MAQNLASDQSAMQPTLNPFPVYPVVGLTEITKDIAQNTVLTPEITTVRDTIRAYLNAYHAEDPKARHHLIFAVKGDFGAGKTHLILYAKSLVEEREKRSIVLVAPAMETPVETWYSEVLGPALLEARPRLLLRDMLTHIASQLAKESPLTRHLADRFLEDPSSLSDALSDSDKIDSSEVRRRFDKAIEKLCPGSSSDLHRALRALPWAETSDAAEAWLAGQEMQDADLRYLGLTAPLDCSVGASAVIHSFAAICDYLRRPFALFIDEFEHLAREDARTGSRRNITWVKRLVEALTRHGAIVLVAGHWEAWNQQQDFIDRFRDERPIQLLRLTEKDVIAIIAARAPEWQAKFTRAATQTLIDVTGGNIRRVMTVLYDLYAQTHSRDELINPDDVTRALGRRLEPSTGDALIPTIEHAAWAHGGEVLKNVNFPELKANVDVLVRLNGEERLVVEIVYARDQAQVLERGDLFADQVRSLKQKAPNLRGLFIAMGAVSAAHLKTLDAARTEIDVENGEDPLISEHVTRHVEAALSVSTTPRLNSPSEEVSALRSELLQLRSDLLAQSEKQLRRSEAIFRDDGPRNLALQKLAAADAEDVARQKNEIERRHMLENILAEERQLRVIHYLTSFFSFTNMGFLLAGVGLLLIANVISNNPALLGYASKPQWEITVLGLHIWSAVFFVVAAIFIVRTYIAADRYRRFRMSTVDEMALRNIPVAEIVKVRRELDQAVEKAGVRRAARWFAAHR